MHIYVKQYFFQCTDTRKHKVMLPLSVISQEKDFKYQVISEPGNKQRSFLNLHMTSQHLAKRLIARENFNICFYSIVFIGMTHSLCYCQPLSTPSIMYYKQKNKNGKGKNRI